jgi:hypothetical protein
MTSTVQKLPHLFALLCRCPTLWRDLDHASAEFAACWVQAALYAVLQNAGDQTASISASPLCTISTLLLAPSQAGNTPSHQHTSLQARC